MLAQAHNACLLPISIGRVDWKKVWRDAISCFCLYVFCLYFSPISFYLWFILAIVSSFVCVSVFRSWKYVPKCVGKEMFKKFFSVFLPKMELSFIKKFFCIVHRPIEFFNFLPKRNNIFATDHKKSRRIPINQERCRCDGLKEKSKYLYLILKIYFYFLRFYAIAAKNSCKLYHRQAFFLETNLIFKILFPTWYDKTPLW